MAENVYRKKTKIFSGIVMVVSVALCLFQMYAGGISNISSMTLRTIHWTVISAVAILPRTMSIGLFMPALLSAQIAVRYASGSSYS